MISADVLIIGAGPAGVQAAIHAARKKVSVTLVGKASNSAMSGTHIENYFGIPGVTDGDAILRTGLEQAKGFGCTVLEENITTGFRWEAEWNDAECDVTIDHRGPKKTKEPPPRPDEKKKSFAGGWGAGKKNGPVA